MDENVNFIINLFSAALIIIVHEESALNFFCASIIYHQNFAKIVRKFATHLW